MMTYNKHIGAPLAALLALMSAGLVFFGFVFFSTVNSANAQELSETQDTSIATNLGLYGSHTWDIAVDPNNTENIYIATYYSPNGLFYSVDGGETWQGLPADVDHGSGHDVEVNPDNGHVYALLNELLVSEDNFATYTVAADYGSGAGSLLYAQDRLVVSSGGDVHVSADEGASFTDTTVCENNQIWSLASSSDALYALCYDYSAEQAALYRSADLGASWTDLNLETAQAEDAEKVAVNPVNDNVILVPSSLGGATYRSDDDGASWTALATAPASGHMTFDSLGNMYSGWYRSTDNGDTWEPFGDTGDYNHFIVPDPVDANTFYDSSAPGFSKSIDAGATWTPFVTGITAVETTSIAQAADKNYVWVATQNGPAMTSTFLSDAPSWTYVSTGDNFTSSGYDAVWVKPTDSNVVVTSSSQALQYTTDGGATWSDATVDITLSGAVFQIVNNSDGTLYAVVGPNTTAGAQTGGVITSSDDGATWTSLDFPNDGAVRSIAVASDNDLFVGAHSIVGGMYKYDGTSWTKLDAPDDYEYRAVVADPADSNIVYALASKSTSDTGAGVYVSTDDGVTWTASNTGLGNLNDIQEFNTLALQTSTDPDTLYMSAVQNGTAKGMVYKSSDGGANWDMYYTGKKGETFKALLFDGLVAGNSRGIYTMKSRASLSFKVNRTAQNQKRIRLRLHLNDAATSKNIAGRVKVYKKTGQQDWQMARNLQLKKNGRKTVFMKNAKAVRLYAKWVPGQNFNEEYATARSITRRVKAASS